MKLLRRSVLVTQALFLAIAVLPPAVMATTGYGPDAPTLVSPTDREADATSSPTLVVHVRDPEDDRVTVTFYGRPYASGTFVEIAQVDGIVSGSDAFTPWPDLYAGQEYEWYATASDGESDPVPSPTWRFHTLADTDPVLVGAGDIGDCARPQRFATGRIITGIDGQVFTAGDNVQTSGAIENYADCLHPAWGGLRSRIRPVPGNHDWHAVYVPDNLSGYFGYYGTAANAPGPSYYSYDLPDSDWHVVNLDTQCSMVGGCEAGSPQESWLRADLAANSAKNVVVVWHEPRFSSGVTSLVELGDMYHTMYEFGVDLLIQGHDHFYERTAPMDPTGQIDQTFGIRQFTVGTGGAPLQTYSPRLGSNETGSATHGVLKLTLHPASYHWVFLPIAGQGFIDSGSGSVHGAPPVVAALEPQGLTATVEPQGLTATVEPQGLTATVEPQGLTANTG